jgi:hypothetical protein
MIVAALVVALLPNIGVTRVDCNTAAAIGVTLSHRY